MTEPTPANQIDAPNLYTRWTKTGRGHVADILGDHVSITADPDNNRVYAYVGWPANNRQTANLDPDTARMIGVRLIEAAAKAEDMRRTRDLS